MIVYLEFRGGCQTVKAEVGDRGQPFGPDHFACGEQRQPINQTGLEQTRRQRPTTLTENPGQALCGQRAQHRSRIEVTGPIGVDGQKAGGRVNPGVRRSTGCMPICGRVGC